MGPQQFIDAICIFPSPVLPPQPLVDLLRFGLLHVSKSCCPGSGSRFPFCLAGALCLCMWTSQTTAHGHCMPLPCVVLFALSLSAPHGCTPQSLRLRLQPCHFQHRSLALAPFQLFGSWFNTHGVGAPGVMLVEPRGVLRYHTAFRQTLGPRLHCALGCLAPSIHLAMAWTHLGYAT